MTLISWRDSFELGIDSVDHEHRALIEIINTLYRALADDPKKDKVMAFFGELYARISAHFALEEAIMRDREYDQLDDHKEDHERLLDEIRDIMDRYEADAYFDYREVLAPELEAWFTEHFRTRDARLHKMLG